MPEFQRGPAGDGAEVRRPQGTTGRMDKSEFIEKLNEDLGTEFQSIVQYVQHMASIKAAEHGSIVAELGNHLGQELEYARIPASPIDFLGGTPTSPAAIAFASSVCKFMPAASV
jgi:hypothetical protein